MKKGCHVAIFNWCYLIQETFKSPLFVFKEVDISSDQFIYTVRKRLGSKSYEFNAIVQNDTVSLPPLNLPKGDYIHELLWINRANKTLVFQGELKIDDKGKQCGCDDNSANSIIVDNGNTIIEISIEGSGGGASNWGSITGDINNQTDLITLIDDKIEEIEVDLSNYDTRVEVDNKIEIATDDMATQTWVENKNYLTTETDPSVPSHVKSITTSDILNWNNKQNQLTAGSNISIVGNTISANVDLTGYATQTWVNNQNFATTSEIPTNTSDLVNDSDFITSSDLPTVGNGTITINQGGTLKGTFTTNQNGNTTIDLSEGLESIDWSDIENKPNFSTVATSGSYDDLTNKPTIYTDFKTINGNTILGTGDLVVGGGTKVVTNGSNIGIQTVNGGTVAHLGIGNGAVDLVYAASTGKGASGAYSFACGFGTIASNEYSFACGFGTIASGYSSFAYGYDTRASGNYSFASGSDTTASGSYSFAIGLNTTASGSYSFASGIDTIASGAYSFASGNKTRASGAYSFAYGNNTTAWAYSHFVIGRFNTIGTAQESWVNGAPIFTVGNGTSNSVRSNSYVLHNNGNSEQQGDVEITTIGKGIIMKSPNGTRYRIKVNDDGTLSTELAT